MKVIARQCGFTGILFKDDAAYFQHLMTRRDMKREERRIARIRASFDADNAPLYQLRSIEAIEEWLNQNIVRILEYHGPRHWSTKSKKKTPVLLEKDTVVIKFNQMRFKKECRTTHSAPKGQRTTGWSIPHVPELGWYGQIEITFGTEKAYDFFDSRYLKDLAINTGTGGGCSKKLSYDVTLFAKDFRKLASMLVYDKLGTE